VSESEQEEKLSWEYVVTKFERLIKFASRQQVDTKPTDGMISAEDLYQDGMLQLYDSWINYGHKPEEEFSYIFRASLWRRMGRSAGIQRNNIDLSDVSDTLKDENNIDIVERMYVGHGIKHLKTMLANHIAIRLVDEFIEPSEKTYFEVWADIKRKEMLKSQGKKVNIPKDTTIRMKHIIRSLGITTKQYDIAMFEIRQKAELAFNSGG